MLIAKIQCDKVRAQVLNREIIPAGLIGGEIWVEFTDPTWDNLSKTAVFRGGDVTKDVLNIGNAVLIPQEVLAEPGRRIEVGFYGANGDGTVAIPTLWAVIGTTRDAADPSGDPSTDPALPVWAQIQKQVDDLAASGGGGGGGPSDAVRYGPQTLTDDQKTQARKNIGAATVQDILDALPTWEGGSY